MAIEDTIATFALVGATLVLAYNTWSLYRATTVLGQIERKRDLRQAFGERIEIGENLAAVQPAVVTEYLGGASRHAPVVLEAAAWIRRLRTLLPKDRDENLPSLKFSLDYVMMNMDRADGGSTDFSGVEKEVVKHVDNIKGRLTNNLLPKWRRELEALYGE
jgi:hypothetical protein